MEEMMTKKFKEIHLSRVIRVSSAGTKTTRLCFFTNIEYIVLVSIRGEGHVLSLVMPSKYMQHTAETKTRW